MKRWLPLLVPILASAAIAQAETVQEIYARGVRASIGGDNATARQLFLQVLAADPDNKAAAANIRRIDLATATKGDLKSRMAAIIVPKIDFKEASLTSVLDYLPKLAAQQPGAPPLNIVRMFPKEYGDTKSITLQLSNVPMTDALDYIAQLGGVTVTYEKAAVVIRQPEAAKAQ